MAIPDTPLSFPGVLSRMARMSETNSATESVMQEPAVGTSDLQPALPLDPELEAMFRAKIHVGYSRTRRHPKMKPFIFGLRNNVEVFDLEKVRENIRAGEAWMKTLGERKATILFVGSKPAVASAIEKAASELGMPYVANRWPGGLLTNFSELRKRLDYFEDLKAKRAAGDLARYTKKEQLVFADELTRLEQKFGGIVSLKKIPDAMVIVDPVEEKAATSEAHATRVPSLGIANVDCNPESVTQVIPANDSSTSSVGYIVERLVAAYKAGLPA